MKIQDGGLAAILDFGSAWKSYLTCILYVPISDINFKTIGRTVLQKMHGNENPRWRPGGHIGFRIGLKIELDPYLLMVQLYSEYHFNISNGSEVNARKRRCDGRTEGRNDGMTEGQPGVTLYAPSILWRGHKKSLSPSSSSHSEGMGIRGGCMPP